MTFFESAVVKNQNKDKRESLREGLTRALDEFGDDTNPIKFVSLLNDFVEYGWKPTLKPWKTIRDYLAPDYVAKTSRVRSIHSELKIAKPSAQQPLTFEFDVKDNMDNKSQSSSSSIGLLRPRTKNFFSSKDKKESAPMPNSFSKNNVGNDIYTLIFVSDENIWKYLQSIIPIELRDIVHRDLKWFQDEYAKGDSSRYYAKASRENASTIDAFGRYLERKTYADKISIPDIINFLKNFYVI